MTRAEYYQKWVSRGNNREKVNKQKRARVLKIKKDNPIKYKAMTLISGFNWGKGGADRMIAMLKQYLQTPCKYCGTVITLDNCSVDHKLPYAVANKVNRTGSKLVKAKYTPEEEKYLKSADNLHIICFSCNKIKSNMTDEQFVRLLKFLDTDSALKTMILARLKRSNVIWGRR